MGTDNVFKNIWGKCRSYFKKRSLPTRTLVLSVSAALVILLVQGAFSYKTYADFANNREIAASYRNRMEELSKSVSDYLRGMDAKMESINNWTDAGYQFDIFARSGGQDMGAIGEGFAENYYNNNFDDKDGVIGLYFYLNNKTIVSAHVTVKGKKYTRDVINHNTVADSAKLDSVMGYVASPGRTVFIDSYYNKILRRNVLRMAMKIVNGKTQENTGFMLVDFDEYKLKEIFNMYRVYDGQVIRLETRDGQALSTAGGSALAELFINRDAATSFIKPVNGFNANVSAFLTAYPVVRNLAGTGMALLIIVMAVMLVMQIVVAAEPQKTAAARTANIMGNASAFREMLVKAGRMAGAGDDTAIYRDFLIETLQDVENVCSSSDRGLARGTYRALAGMFRYCTDKNGLISTVSDEIGHVRDYLLVRSSKTPDDSKVRIYCSEGLLGGRLPRLILKPLVENSIEHGLKRKKGKKLVKIKIFSRDNLLHIHVIDNGSGMDTASLKTLKSRLSGKNALSRGFDSPGLVSINQITKVLFGEAASIDILSKKGKGTMVKLVFPAL